MATKNIKVLLLFVYGLFIDFYKNNGLMRAGSLAYTIMLSLVPFCIASASILSFLPVFRNIGEEVMTRALFHLTPTLSAALNQALALFSTQAEKLSWISFVFLFLSGVLMLFTIETNVNEMWGADKNRSLGMSLLISWILMLLAPLLLGLSILMSTYLTSIHWIRHTIAPGLGLVPYLLSIAAFTILYKLIPARRVRIKSAFIGGVSAGILFELAKKIFVLYIKHFSSDNILYGAFAVFPLLMLWIYICAILFLFNAKLVQRVNETFDHS